MKPLFLNKIKKFNPPQNLIVCWYNQGILDFLGVINSESTGDWA